MFGMRPFRYLPKAIRVLLIINAVVFLLGMLGGEALTVKIRFYGALIPAFMVEPWRYLTYAFVHGGFWHFLFNMMMLWMFGDEVCDYLGEKKFVGLYLFSAIFAGLFSIPFYIFGLLSPYSLIIGASGALMGVFVAYYKFFPERTLLMFFVIPMKIKYAIWVLILFDILLSRTNDSIAHFTHLGGVVAGFIFMALFSGNGLFANGIRGPRFKKPKFKVYSNENVEDAEVLEGEVFDMDDNKRLDEILKKVKEQGVQSLTFSEREFLLKKSKEMNGRN